MAGRLRQWLAGRVAIRPTTRLSHAGCIEQFLVPHVGLLTLQELTVTRLSEMFTRIARQTNRAGRPPHPVHPGAHVRRCGRRSMPRSATG
jgi:hypothetical protein